MDSRLELAIQRLDINAVRDLLEEKADTTGLTLSHVIEQLGDAEERMISDEPSQKGDYSILCGLDKCKTQLVIMLLESGILPDEDSLIDCYVYRCPMVAIVLLNYGCNPNQDWGGHESILLRIRLGIGYREFNTASFTMLRRLEETLRDRGGVKFHTQDFLIPKGKPYTMVIFMGLQASGKTTFYERMFRDQGYMHINMDSLKGKKRRKEGEMLQECIDKGINCVIDNTNPKRSDRARYIVPGHYRGFRIVGYYFQSKLNDCIARNDTREKQVDLRGILSTYNKLEMPSLEEGFDELNFVSIQDGEYVISKWKEDEI